ncbi:prostate stem cell antigen-like [Ascaphus truei]|uniref:prostate stem cell antigen-like n=1 Tax=Ascaphus truei TaxID=8439 RepID=UPI003F59A1EE
MRQLLPALWLVLGLWGTDRVTSLQCYSCINVKDNKECNQKPPETCTENQTMCQSRTETIFLKVIITKRCSDQTECYKNSTSSSWIIAKTTDACCSEDLCNVYGRSEMGPRQIWALLGPATVLTVALVEMML